MCCVLNDYSGYMSGRFHDVGMVFFKLLKVLGLPLILTSTLFELR